MSNVKIVNCSSITLTPSQIELLKKGLKFCPVPKNTNLTELSADVRSLSRKMRLNEFFHDKDFQQQSIMKKPSSFTPFPERDEHLDRYCDFLSSIASNLQNLPSQNKKDNLSRFERSALKELTDLVDANRIVIMPADKGGAVVILEGDHYKRMVNTVFNDPEYFEDSDGNQMRQIIGKIRTLCLQYNTMLTKEEIAFLTNFDYRESNFYGLPKIHKSDIIKEAVKTQRSEVVSIPSPSDLKIRPIIGGPVSPTSNLSRFLDKILKPYMMKLPSFVRDSADLLNQANEWESNPDEEYVLVTMDITNMYMNVSENLGIKAVRYFLNEFPDLLHPRLNPEFVVDAILIVLRNNISYFDGVYKRQTHGCAMGSHKSPPYSSLAVGYIEKETYARLESTKGHDYATYVSTMLRRFLDDIFLKWRRSLGDPMELFNVLNSIDEKIKFTIEMGETIPFLDVNFTVLDNGSLETDIYYKETDTHNFVQFGSFHPHKTLTNIPFSLARRICLIVSCESKRNSRLRELKGFLTKKKYPESVIDSGISRACQLNRQDLLLQRPTTDNNDTSNIPFVFTNNCANPDVLHTVRRGLDILLPSDRMNTVMQNKKVVAARRQPKNMKALLFRPRFESSDQRKTGGILPCKKDPNRKRTQGRPCKCCDLLQECTSFNFKGTAEPFELRYQFTCDTKNVVYLLTCQGCGSNYIGKTEREVRERCGEHRLAIEKKQFTQGVHKHIHDCGKGFLMTPFF